MIELCKNENCQNFKDLNKEMSQKRIETETQWQIAILSVSIIISIPALVIFLAKKDLRNRKFSLFYWLIKAILCRNLFILLSKIIITINQSTSTDDNTSTQWPCKFLTIVEKLAGNFVFTFFLLNVVYLHQRISDGFQMKLKQGHRVMYVLLGSSLVSICAAVGFQVTIEFTMNENCWNILDYGFYHWINDAPNLVMLLATISLIFHIMLQMYRNNSANRCVHKAIQTTKMTIICLPGFWMPFVCMIITEASQDSHRKEINECIVIIMEALQGISISLLCFYCDSDFRKVLCQVFKIRERILSVDSQENLAPKKSKTSLQSSPDFQPKSDCCSWQEVVIRARSSISDPNSINIHIPAEKRTRKLGVSSKDSVQRLTNSNISLELPQKHAFKDVMLRARPISVAPPMSPPIPKHIPDEILDDVQLFDFYYKNLDTIFISSVIPQALNEVKIEEKRSSVQKIRRMLSLVQDKTLNSKLSGNLSYDEQSTSDDICNYR